MDSVELIKCISSVKGEYDNTEYNQPHSFKTHLLRRDFHTLIKRCFVSFSDRCEISLFRYIIISRLVLAKLQLLLNGFMIHFDYHSNVSSFFFFDLFTVSFSLLERRFIG